MLKFHWWVCQNCILRIRRKFWGKVVFFEKNDSFPSFQDSEQKVCHPLRKKFRRGCQNSFLRVHRIILMKTMFFQNKILMNLFFEKKILIFFGHSAVSLRLSVQNIWRWVFKTAFYVSMRKFRSKICSERLFILFGHWKKHFRRFVEILSAGLSKMHPKCRQRFLRKSSFLGKKRNSFHHQLALSKKYAAFCRKNFGWVVKTVFYMSIETLWWVFFEKNFLFFRHSAMKMWHFLENFSAGSSKLQPTCPWESFEENWFFGIKIEFFHHFPTSSGNVSPGDEWKSAGWSILHSMCTSQ